MYKILNTIMRWLCWKAPARFYTEGISAEEDWITFSFGRLVLVQSYCNVLDHRDVEVSLELPLLGTIGIRAIEGSEPIRDARIYCWPPMECPF